MSIRPFNLEKDYEKVAGWWTRRGLPEVPKVILRAAHGFFAHEDEQDIAVGWVYFDEKNVIGLVDWISTNPDLAAYPTIPNALNELLQRFQSEAVARDCHNLFTFVAKDTGLHRLMVREGWQDPHSASHIYLFRSWQ